MSNFDVLRASYKFIKNSPLQAYLQQKKAGEYIQDTFTLEMLLTVLKVIISEEILYDIKNVAIILCDSKLETALNINGLHVKDVKKCVLKQLICLTPPQSQITTKKRKVCEEVDFPKNVNNKKLKISNTEYYTLSPLFRDALLSVPFFPHNLQTFTYNEICSYLSQYITYKKEKLLDPRNIFLCVVKNDPLGKAFNVNAFDRCQVVSLLLKNIIPVIFL